MEDAQGIVAARASGAVFMDQTDLVRRVGLTQTALSILADAGALESLSGKEANGYAALRREWDR